MTSQDLIFHCLNIFSTWLSRVSKMCCCYIHQNSSRINWLRVWNCCTVLERTLMKGLSSREGNYRIWLASSTVSQNKLCCSKWYFSFPDSVHQKGPSLSACSIECSTVCFNLFLWYCSPDGRDRVRKHDKDCWGQDESGQNLEEEIISRYGKKSWLLIQ